jgi:hypothetical protein
VLVSEAGDACVKRVLRTLSSAVRRAADSTTDRRARGVAVRHLTSASAVAGRFYALCPKQRYRTVNLAGGVQSRTMLEKSLRLDKSHAGVPQPAELIPRQRLLVWSRRQLFAAAQELEDRWQVNEPSLTTRIITDDECRDFASRVPGMLAVYDTYPVPVMRADVCRVLAVYFLGGIYMDLDVGFERPLDEWFNFSHDIALGYEYNSPQYHRCNWFFGAKARHPCLLGALQQFIELGKDGKVLYEVRNEPHFVHKLTGPGAFGRGLIAAKCPDVQHSAEELHFDGIRHIYGSVTWTKRRATGYRSWIEERDAAHEQARNASTSSGPAPSVDHDAPTDATAVREEEEAASVTQISATTALTSGSGTAQVPAEATAGTTVNAIATTADTTAATMATTTVAAAPEHPNAQSADSGSNGDLASQHASN